MVYTEDLKSLTLIGLRVRVPLPAQDKRQGQNLIGFPRRERRKTSMFNQDFARILCLLIQDER